MSLPQPIVNLTDICAVMYDNVLYTYSESAFQSLEFAQGAEWQELASGEAVSGAACVGSTPADSSQAGFYVVGGSGSSNYTGLQKFTYATGEWETITPQSLVTQDRLYHGAVYINDSDTILVYAGSQDGATGESTQTFTIGASSPYNVLSYQSIAPPTKNPILLPWSSSEAVLIGGSTTNTEVMLFDPTTGGWVDSGATLSEGLSKDISSMQAALVTGDDSSKSLYILDMSVSPNEISRVVLMDASGAAVTDSAPVKRELIERSDNLTLSDWPTYNATLAPTATRTGFSVAQGSDGTIVAAGGSEEDVLCVFNGWENAWQNATTIFSSSKKNGAAIISSSATASVSASETASSTSAASSSASSTAAAVATSHGTSTGTIVGAVVGSVAGVAIILLVAFFLIARKRRQNAQKKAAHNRNLSQPTSEKDSYDVVSNQLMPRPIGGGGKPTFRVGHQAQDSTGSFSSVAILMGRVNQPRPPMPVQRNNSRDTKRSSASSLFNKAFKSTISKPIPQTRVEQSMAEAGVPQQAQFERAAPAPYGPGVAEPRPRDDDADRRDSMRRSSGWNRYWSGGSALNIIGFGNGNASNVGGSSPGSQIVQGSNRVTMVSDMSSNYSASGAHRITQDSATVPPLAVPEMPDAKPHFQRVNSGSPTVASFNAYLATGMKGKIERPTSRSSSQSGYSSGIPASVHEAWDPTGYEEKPWGADRAPSSMYSMATGVQGGGLMSGPGAGKKQYVPTGMSQQPQLARANTSSDMSWLNLGDVSRI